MNEEENQIKKSARHLIFILSTIVITGLGHLFRFRIVSGINLRPRPSDLLVISTAGNSINEIKLGSMEYAVLYENRKNKYD